jgi:hypothetical protein
MKASGFAGTSDVSTALAGCGPRVGDVSELALAGDVRFLDTQERAQAVAALIQAGLFVVTAHANDSSARGKLGEVIDEAIERELHARGAMGQGLVAVASFDSYRDAALSDQLFRARRAGATGLAIVLGPLRLMASAGGAGVAALDPADTATLGFLAEAARQRLVVLVLDQADRTTQGYTTPAPLAEILAPRIVPTLAPPAAPAAMPPPLPARPAPAPAPAPDETWRAHHSRITAARGPQPLAALEKLFAESYVPLAMALANGVDDSQAREANDHFAATFAKSYSDAFPTFAATSKRPRMVLDAHDVAARMARLHGARTVRLLLVDAMRWDLAQMVKARLIARMSGVTLTDELILWSALPTNTMRQLETIARGLDALRAPAPIEGDPELPRGRNADYVRRMRVGPREIHKLDVVESRLRDARANVLRELPGITEEVAEAVARHAQSLAPRTLLFVFGDHGFRVDRKGFATQGGASPEEVLVGAFALLVGDVH